jgi:hypothetical protein
MPLLTAKNAVVEDVEGSNMPLAGPISFPATSARLNSTFSPVTNPLQEWIRHQSNKQIFRHVTPSLTLLVDPSFSPLSPHLVANQMYLGTLETYIGVPNAAVAMLRTAGFLKDGHLERSIRVDAASGCGCRAEWYVMCIVELR